MTLKEKAIELVDKFTIPYYQWDGDGYNIDWEETFKNRKQCALIAVDEILNNIGQWVDGELYYTSSNTIKFYKAVKQEIEKL